MEATPKKLYVVGRLKTVASRRQRRRHIVTISSDSRLLSSTTTDSGGRFLLEWPNDPSDDKFVLRLLKSDQSVAETLELGRADLISPPFVGFQGDSVLSEVRLEPEVDANNRFEADGDYPLSVTSSCQQVTLSWRAPTGSMVSIISEGSLVGEGFGAEGSLNVFVAGNKSYMRRAWLPGDQKGFSDLTLEVRRHPALSVILQGSFAKSGSEIDVGASTSCPAGPRGILVTVMTSDSEMVPQFDIPIPAGSKWGQMRVKLGGKAGRVKMVAMAPGYTRDGVTLMLG